MGYQLTKEEVEELNKLVDAACEKSVVFSAREADRARDIGLGKAIKCPQCEMVSYSLHDVRRRYCGNCHAFHCDMVQPVATPKARGNILDWLRL